MRYHLMPIKIAAIKKSTNNKCWRGFPFPSPGDLLDPGIEPASPALARGFFTTGATTEAQKSQ